MAGITGGVKVVYQYANYLQSKGHMVRILYPGTLFPDTNSFKWKLESIARELKYSGESLVGKNEATTWFPLIVPLLHVPSLEAHHIPSADITIATSNETADWVVQLPSRCGSLFYFIQGHEIWNRSEEDIIATYKLPLKKIVICTYLKQIVENCGESICGIAPNGFDSTIFNKIKKKWNTPPRILMLSHDAESKGTKDGFEAIRLIKKEFPTIQLVMFGAHAPRPDMLAETEYHQNPNDLPKLYSSCDIFISPSWLESWGLPSMEAMACGTAVVATNSGGIIDFAINGKTALLVPPKHPEKLAEAVLKLLKDRDLLKKISEGGHAHIQEFTLEKATSNFEHLLLQNYR